MEMIGLLSDSPVYINVKSHKINKAIENVKENF